MRTTVTLDPDVAAKLKAEAQKSGSSFKEVLNASVRRGLGSKAQPPERYTVKARALKVRPGVDLSKALSLASELEDAETLRKISLRK